MKVLPPVRRHTSGQPMPRGTQPPRGHRSRTRRKADAQSPFSRVVTSFLFTSNHRLRLLVAACWREHFGTITEGRA